MGKRLTVLKPRKINTYAEIKAFADNYNPNQRPKLEEYYLVATERTESTKLEIWRQLKNNLEQLLEQ